MWNYARKTIRLVLKIRREGKSREIRVSKEKKKILVSEKSMLAKK